MNEENTDDFDSAMLSDPHDIFDTSKWPPNARLLSCDICDQKFSNKSKIVVHWCTAHQYKMCGFCTNYAFKYDSDKIQHERQHIPYGCSICPHEFHKICEDSISQHYKQTHQSFLCPYCSSVIQPYDKYPEHIEKKHNAINYAAFVVQSNRHELFRLITDEEDEELFYCNLCNKKKRVNLLFGHYVFYHNISIHALKRCLDSTHPDLSVNGSVLSSNLEKDDTSIDMEESENSREKACTVCENPFKYDEITKELHGVFCKGHVVCSLKDCSRTFETTDELKKHSDLQHSSLVCKFGCPSEEELKPVEINQHLENFHDLVECFLCSIVNSSGTFQSHLRDKHHVSLSIYEKAMSQSSSSKLFRVSESSKTSILCNFCNYDLTDEIKQFSFIDHYKNQHEINDNAILRNLVKNPIIDLINSDAKKSKMDEESLENFIVKMSYENLIETDFDGTKVYCIGIEHIEEKPKFNSDDDDDGEKLLVQLLTCELCTQKFNKTCEFYGHLTEIHGFRLLNVNACDKCNIQNSETITNHDNKDFMLTCPYEICHLSFVSKTNFTNHLIFEHSEKEQLGSEMILYKCRLCNFAYKRMKDIRSHFSAQHPNIVMKYCRICRFKLSSNESDHFTLNHAEDMKRIERFCCKICKKEFKKESTAKLHYAKTHKKKDTKKKQSFKCQYSECSESFANKEDRKMHQIFAHPNEKLFPCKHCPMKFATKSSLSSHNVVHKNIVNTCDYCHKTFLRRDSFKEHLLIHSDVRLKCSFCEKVFVQRSNLVRHERIHLNDKPYKCTYCDKSFSDKGACTSHEKVHTKTEHADCEVCGKHFARKQKLKYHMRLHTLENVLTCECGKIFPESYSFRKHQETHQNKNESTRCKFCDMVFKSKKSRENHEQTEHGHGDASKDPENEELLETSIQCTICNLNDFTPDNIKDHLIAVHNIESGNDWKSYITEVEFKMDITTG